MSDFTFSLTEEQRHLLKGAVKAEIVRLEKVRDHLLDTDSDGALAEARNTHKDIRNLTHVFMLINSEVV